VAVENRSKHGDNSGKHAGNRLKQGKKGTRKSCCRLCRNEDDNSCWYCICVKHNQYN